MFFRRSKNTRDPLAVAMSGVRLGERVLQIGVDDPKVVGLVAAKAGMSGTAACVVADAAAARRAQSGADGVGVLVETAVTPFGSPLPHDSGAFDVAIIHSVSGFLASLDATARDTLLREVGRVVQAGRQGDRHRGGRHRRGWPVFSGGRRRPRPRSTRREAPPRR